MKIYALAVCFASLMCGTIVTGLLLYNIVKIVAPESTIDPNTLHYYSSNEAYRNSPFSAARIGYPPIAIASGRVFAPPVTITNAQTNTPELSEEEIEKQRLQQLDSVLTGHKFRARQGIIQQSIIMLLSLVLFVAHWKLAKKFNRDSST